MLARVSQLVRLDRQDEVAWIILDRPEVLNALSREVLEQLSDIFASLAREPRARVVIVTGSGEKAFCAGADLRERVDFNEAATRAYVARIGEVFAALAALPQPSIAAINGVAFGGGLELALACDLRVAASHAKLGLTETSLAIIPGAGGTQRLPAVVGLARAKELIYTARRIDAARALQIGLVSQVVNGAELREAALSLAREITANGPLAVVAAKAALDLSARPLSLDDRLAGERALYLERVLPSRDRLEALAAFRDKRKPVWRGE